VSSFSPSSASGSPAFDYAPGQPNLYRMMRFKQRVVQQLGVHRGFDAYREEFGLSVTARLKRMPLVSQRDFAAAHARFFKETGAAGQPFTHPVPPVYGPGNHKPIEGTTRSQYIAQIDDARLMGRSAGIVVHGRVLLDFQGRERERLDDELEWDAGVFWADGDELWYIERGEQAAPLLIDEAFSLLGAHTDFFGHWMSEYLPAYVAARLAGVPARKILIDSHMPPSHRQALELLFADEVEIVEVPAFRAVHVQRLWVAPSLMYMALHEKRNERFTWEATAASPEQFGHAVAEMRRRTDAALVAAVTTKRVFLARKALRHRKLVNRDEIESMAARVGFTIAYPEDLSFAEQLALVRGADRILAPEGSAIFLAFFAPMAAKLCVLTHPLTDVVAEYNGLLAVHGIEVCGLSGPFVRHNEEVPHDSDYEIPPDTFSRFLLNWLE
jgi:capsular polysaccharide biosynthesis protein